VLETPAGKIYVVCDPVMAAANISTASPRPMVRSVWHSADRAYGALVHAGPAHEPSDAVKAWPIARAQALAHHHGTFQLTDERSDAPLTGVACPLDDAKIRASALWRSSRGR